VGRECDTLLPCLLCSVNDSSSVVTSDAQSPPWKDVGTADICLHASQLVKMLMFQISNECDIVDSSSHCLYICKNFSFWWSLNIVIYPSSFWWNLEKVFTLEWADFWRWLHNLGISTSFLQLKLQKIYEQWLLDQLWWNMKIEMTSKRPWTYVRCQKLDFVVLLLNCGSLAG